MIGQDKVDGPADVLAGMKAAEQAQHKATLLLVDRGGEQRFLTVPLA
jgi:hypothetical protein